MALVQSARIVSLMWVHPLNSILLKSMSPSSSTARVKSSSSLGSLLLPAFLLNFEDLLIFIPNADVNYGGDVGKTRLSSFHSKIVELYLRSSFLKSFLNLITLQWRDCHLPLMMSYLGVIFCYPGITLR